MRRSVMAMLLGALLATRVPLHAQAVAPSRRLVLLHANVIDGTGAAPLRDVSIVIAGGRIVSIGTPGATGADTIDVGGRWVVPGLPVRNTSSPSSGPSLNGKWKALVSAGLPST